VVAVSLSFASSFGIGGWDTDDQAGYDGCRQS
jgi:hypothetical protein